MNNLTDSLIVLWCFRRIWGPFVPRNEPRNSSDSHAYDRKNVVRASVNTRTIDNENRSRIVTRSDRSVVRQVDCNGVARSDDLLRDRIRKKLNTFVLPPAIHSYVQKTEVYYSALQTTYRLSTIRWVICIHITSIFTI